MQSNERTLKDEYSRYRDFIQDLQELIALPFPARQDPMVQGAINSALNGEATEALHRLIDRNTLKKDGVFFTPKKLAERLIEMLPSRPALDRVFYDPACGTGNLLLECANLLPVYDSFDDTIEEWGRRLWGHDLHVQFIETTKLRLVLLALNKGNFKEYSFSMVEIFPHICVGDSLSDDSGYQAATHTVMNPPYTHCKNHSSTWASGKVSSAAIHYDMAIKKTSDKGVVAAILPDVLRSGTRYKSWRENISEEGCLDVAIEMEQFAKDADVNTFYLVLDRSKKPNNFEWHAYKRGKTLEAIFRVNVGAVVPHRHADVGQKVPFVHAKRLEPWATIKEVQEYRGFKGTCRKGPFVAIRRTSRPDDRYRAVGTIIEDGRAIAVENHLIVCSPSDGSLNSCMKLIELLKDERLNDWLNDKIRCRHLTVESILSAPCYEYFEGKEYV